MSSLDTCGGSQFTASTTISFDGNTLPTGLIASTDFINAGDQQGAILSHQFLASNVNVKDGFLELTIPGGQTGDTISGAEVSTTFGVKYGSVCTYAILTEVAGACNGMFFYQSDSQEADIEWLSDSTSGSNTASPNGTRAMQYTNQANNGNPDDATMQYGAAPDDATSAVHEYRLDWLPDATRYYVDGELQVTLEKNVPTEAGVWTWNIWNDGDPEWTGAPPEEDAVLKIQKIVMYYNISDDNTVAAGNGSSNGGGDVQDNDTGSGAMLKVSYAVLGGLIGVGLLWAL